MNINIHIDINMNIDIHIIMKFILNRYIIKLYVYDITLNIQNIKGPIKIGIELAIC